ncbi:LuxR C-terminal-related transcriptional regulator [Streptomyces sp. NPDC058299]|uniref:LuxR C-terminal-related transcriptional regulator n=1 Tax=Streptomyces sp. NPDC058299 TaxID=3346435 RepID=UPI0036EFB3B4
MTPTSPPSLTDVQRFVLERVAAGATCRQVSRELHCSEVTVRSHSMRLRERLGADTLAHAVDIAHRIGLLDGHAPRPADAATGPLTDRDLDVLRLIAIGMSNSAIAERLGRRQDAVADQVRRIRGRLGARDRTHAITIAIAHHLIDAGHVIGLDHSRETAA